MFPVNTSIAAALKERRKRKKDQEAPSSALSLPKSLLREVKDVLVSASHESHREKIIEEMQRQLFLAMRSSSGAVRLKALQLIDYLFRNSRSFRLLASQDLRSLVGDFALRSAKTRPAHLKDFHVEYFVLTFLHFLHVLPLQRDYLFGDEQPVLRAAVRYVRESSGVDMPNIAIQLNNRKTAEQESLGSAQWRLLCDMGLNRECKLPLDVVENLNKSLDVTDCSIKARYHEAVDCVHQLNEIYMIIFPSVVSTASSPEVKLQHEAEDTDDEEDTKLISLDVSENIGIDEDNNDDDVEWEDSCNTSTGNAYPVSKDTQKQDRENALDVARSSMPFSMCIQLSSPAAMIEKHADLVGVAESLFKRLSQILIPEIKEWKKILQDPCPLISHVTKALELPDSKKEAIKSSCALANERVTKLLEDAEEFLNSKSKALLAE